MVTHLTGLQRSSEGWGGGGGNTEVLQVDPVMLAFLCDDPCDETVGVNACDSQRSNAALCFECTAPAAKAAV